MIYKSECIADKQIQSIGRITTVNSFIFTSEDILSVFGFPFPVLGGISRSLVTDKHRLAGFGVITLTRFINQLPTSLMRQTVIETFERITHTNDAINRIVVNTRHTHRCPHSI